MHPILPLPPTYYFFNGVVVFFLYFFAFQFQKTHTVTGVSDGKKLNLSNLTVPGDRNE